jgi:prepilin-type N-terminal cleavage/methylation domain-containing protein
MSSTRPRAFSLIEVMVSASLLAVGMVGFLSLFSNIAATYEHHRHLTEALLVGEAAMERGLVLYADDAELAFGNHPLGTFNGVGTPAVGPYTVAWDVSAGPLTGTRALVVTVSWTERGTPRSIALRTVRT